MFASYLNDFKVISLFHLHGILEFFLSYVVTYVMKIDTGYDAVEVVNQEIKNNVEKVDTRIDDVKDFAIGKISNNYLVTKLFKYFSSNF